MSGYGCKGGCARTNIAARTYGDRHAGTKCVGMNVYGGRYSFRISYVLFYCISWKSYIDRNILMFYIHNVPDE